jgi:hypothetical protein
MEVSMFLASPFEEILASRLISAMVRALCEFYRDFSRLADCTWAITLE